MRDGTSTAGCRSRAYCRNTRVILYTCGETTNRAGCAFLSVSINPWGCHSRAHGKLRADQRADARHQRRRRNGHAVCRLLGQIAGTREPDNTQRCLRPALPASATAFVNAVPAQSGLRAVRSVKGIASRPEKSVRRRNFRIELLNDMIIDSPNRGSFGVPLDTHWIPSAYVHNKGRELESKGK